MELKDIFVHLDGSERSHARLDIAVALAKRHQARLTGHFAKASAETVGVLGPRRSALDKSTAEASRELFEKAAGAAGLVATWRVTPSGEYNFVIADVVNAARNHDLAVLGQHDYTRADETVPPELVEQVLVASGRPALVIPFAGEFANIGTRVLVAWNGGREAVRAINDALPLMMAAKEVRVVVVNPPDRALDGEAMVGHLACHGINAVADTLVVEGIGIMDMLLSRAADFGSNLLVMGAHGHYGFPWLNRGAGTRHILRHMTLPVLMSH
ncbi:MAG: universal stress protein [Rhodospirillales bacterium]|nr:universal stress protein [Rhodospirillales bacterium]